MTAGHFVISRRFDAPNKFTCPNCGGDKPPLTRARHVNGSLWCDECAEDAHLWDQQVLPMFNVEAEKDAGFESLPIAQATDSK